MSLKTTAQQLLIKFGRQATFDRVVATSYDPTTSAVDATTTSSFSAYVYPSIYKRFEIDGATITSEDTRLIVEAISGQPEVNDTVTFASTTYRVLDVQQISKNEDNVLYICQVRI